MPTFTLIWLLAGSVLCLMELFLPSAFVPFLMGISAFVVGLLSKLGLGNVWLQVAVWLLLSTTLIVLSRRIVDMEKAWYKVENLQSAMVNLVLTQIRSEMGQLELDQTFTARSQINELLLRDLDVSTDPWGVKVTRVELRDIIPSQAVREAMELQMSAERRKRASILTSEGDRESAVNSARGKADAQLLDAEARQKSVILQAEAEQKAIILKAQAERQQQVLRAQAIAESAEIIAQKIKANPEAHKAVEVLFALGYLDMGTTIGKSDSSKVIFIDPRTIPAALEGIRSVVSDLPTDSHPMFGREIPGGNNRAS